MRSNIFDYKIDLYRAWPPPNRPHAPFGPGTIEIMRSCPLRSCFEASSGYERRLGYAARVGTAFHRALQSLYVHPIPSISAEQIAQEARQRFQVEVYKQDEAATKHLRERTTPREPERIERAAEGIVVEALRIFNEGYWPQPKIGTVSTVAGGVNPTVDTHLAVEIEVPVQSKDGLFQGRVDRIERRPEGVWLYDYKSALREDFPGRYERQLQLYSYLWNQTHGEWPIEA